MYLKSRSVSSLCLLSMPIQIRCTCQQILAVDEAHQGQVVGCPYCGTQLTVPVLQQAPTPAGFAPPPSGFPNQPSPNSPTPGFPGPGFTQPNTPGFSASQPTGQPVGWQPSFPNPGAVPAPSYPASNNPFGSPPPTTESNPFAAPNAPSFPAVGPSNAPSMPFLAIDVPAKSGSSLNDLTQGNPNVPGGWEESAPEEPRIWHIPCPNGHILDTPDDMLDQDVLCPICERQFTLRKFQSVEETQKRERLREMKDEKAGQFWLKLAIGIAAVVILGIIIMIALSASGK
jgi:hypothetical protein